MPTYNFVCKECCTQFSYALSISDFDKFKEGKLTVHCTECNSKNVKKTISIPFVIYKGEGFTKSLKDGGDEPTDLG